MTSEIVVSDDGKYIIVKTIGEINASIALKNNIAAHKLGKELGIARYLVDVREATNTDSIIDQYEFANKHMSMNEDIDKNARVSVLIRTGDTSHHFVETVTHNAGFNLKIFDNMESALKFLLSD